MEVFEPRMKHRLNAETQKTMGKTSIEWTDRSINPIRFGNGHFCQKISPGCAHCYSSRLQPRFGNPEFGGRGGKAPHVTDEPRGSGVWLDQSKLHEILSLRKPNKIFWADMTDLFGEWVPDEFIDLCFATMALAGEQTHQVLTKRPERMLAYFNRVDNELRIYQAMESLADEHGIADFLFDIWPLPNVWLGVSCEDQQRADERIPYLLKTAAEVRFLSCEPLLGQIDLSRACPCGEYCNGGLDWVITGCESGPKRRPYSLEWDADIQEQCRKAGIAFFRKQISINGMVSKEMEEWEPQWRVRQFPHGKAVLP